MGVWGTTYYLAKSGRGRDILDELDRHLKIEPFSNLDGGRRGYLSATYTPEDLDVLLREIDADCWRHVGKPKLRAP